MFSQPQNSIQPTKNNMEVPMVINACSKMTGDLILTTDTRVDGKVYGNIESDCNVIIGHSGYVKGFLRVNNLVVFGRIEGNIIVSGNTILHSGASIFGNLYTRVIEVKMGATITARIKTYVELDAFDEGQLFLAEEMPRFGQKRKSTLSYDEQQDTFDNISKIIKDIQRPDFFNDIENMETSSEQEVSKTEENIIKLTDGYIESDIILKDELNPDPTSEQFDIKSDNSSINVMATVEQANLSESILSPSGLFLAENAVEKATDDLPATPYLVVNNSEVLQNEYTIHEKNSSNILKMDAGETKNEFISQEVIPDSENKLSPIEDGKKIIEQTSTNIIEETTLLETTLVPEPPETIEQVTLKDTISLDEIKPTNDQNVESNVAPNFEDQSVLFKSLLKDSKNIVFSGFDFAMPEKPKPVLSSPVEEKTKKNSFPHFTDLSSLFGFTKSPDEKSADKVIGVPEVKSNNSKAIKHTKKNNIESKGSFLSNSIQNLPESDYSDLFK